MEQEDIFKPQENCGIFGIYSGKPNVSVRIYEGMRKLQHRGNESYGIATFSEPERRIILNRKMGHVFKGYARDEFEQLDGHFGGGHIRYSTRGTSDILHAQPFYFKSQNFGEFALMHNGTIRNADELKKNYSLRDFFSSSDSEVAGRVISLGKDLVDGIKLFSKDAFGSYSFLIVNNEGLYAVRDPFGIKPLCIGNLNGDVAISSESCAFGRDRNIVRDVERGEIYHTGRDGEWSESIGQKQRALDILELMYFAWPKSIIDGIPVANFRMRVGRKLARRDLENKVITNRDGLVVVGVELSGNLYADGYHFETRLPSLTYLMRLRTDRSFIQPSQEEREMIAKEKLDVIESLIEEYGNRIVLLDDSIVRGTTAKTHLIKPLREAGVKEIHFRVGFLPVIDTCPFGIDMKTRGEHFANNYPSDKWASELEVDSLMYSRLEDLIDAANEVCRKGEIWSAHDFCTRCVTGKDPQENKLKA